MPRKLTRVPLEALPDDADDVRRRFELVVAEAVEQCCSPDLLGRPRSRELGAASGCQHRLKDPLVVRVRLELDESLACSLVGELVSRLFANAESPREVGDSQALPSDRSSGRRTNPAKSSEKGTRSSGTLTVAAEGVCNTPIRRIAQLRQIEWRRLGDTRQAAQHIAPARIHAH